VGRLAAGQRASMAGWQTDGRLVGGGTQSSDEKLRSLQTRLESTEQRQQTIISFLARVAQNPAILQQMFQAVQTTGVPRIGAAPATVAPTAGAPAAGRPRCAVVCVTRPRHIWPPFSI
jgi:hypothetical protein